MKTLFKMTSELPCTFTGIESIDCPKCNFRIPVMPEFIDYKELLKRYEKYAQDSFKEFSNFIDELCEYSPDAKIYVETKKKNLYELLERLCERFHIKEDE